MTNEQYQVLLFYLYINMTNEQRDELIQEQIHLCKLLNLNGRIRSNIINIIILYSLFYSF